MKKAIILLGTILLFAVSAFAQIEGRVVDNKGNGVPKVAVTATGEDGKVAATVTTDDDGNYAFGELQPGKFKITAIGPDAFLPAVRENVSVSEDETTSLDITLTPAQTAKTANLALKKGQKFQVTTVFKMNSTADAAGQDVGSVVDSTSVQTVEVKETRPDETDLTVITTRLTTNMNAMGQEVKYDSNTKDNDPKYAVLLGKSVGKVRNFTINAAGKVIKEDKKDENASDPSTMGGGGVTDFPLFCPAIMGHDMAVGSNWPDSVKSNVGKVRTSTLGTYTVKSIDGNTATVTFDGVQTASGVIEQMGYELATKGSNKLTGEIKLDITTGIIIESATTVDGTSMIDAMGMSIPAVMKASTTITVKPM